MKKAIVTMMMAALVMTAAVGCGNGAKTEASLETEGQAADDAAAEDGEQPEASAAMSGAITVLSREDGSGTRGAFIELLGIEQETDGGEKMDMTIDSAEITNSTSVMMTTVAGNESAIGYISLGSLGSDVKAVLIDGVEATVENVKNGFYPVARPFNIATNGEAQGLAKDFIDFILSDEGQAVVEENGYVSQGSSGAFAGELPEGKITVGGSSSVTPVMEKLKEAYEALNSGATIEVQQTDSTTGMTAAMDGTYDIGMASRDLKDSESSLTAETIAMDGIAVIVNNSNPVSELASEDVMKIYTGEITDWSEIAQ